MSMDSHDQKTQQQQQQQQQAKVRQRTAERTTYRRNIEDRNAPITAGHFGK